LFWGDLTVRLSRRGKRRLLLVAGLVLAALLGAVGFKTIRRAQQARLFTAARADGIAAYEAGDLEQAIDRLSYYIQNDNRDVEVLLAFGDARAKVPMANGRHITDAIGIYKHVLTVLDEEPEQPDREARQAGSMRHLLDLYGIAGLRFEQVELADRVLAGDPDDLHALEARAYARLIDRNLDGALEDTRHLATLQPEDITWRQLELEIMRRDGRPPAEMLERIEQWMDEDGEDGRYHVLKAGLLAGGGRPDTAREVMEVAAERGAGSLKVLELMVQMLDELGMRDRARTVIDDAKRRFPNEPWVRQAMVQRLWQAGHLAEAAAELQAAERDFAELSAGLLKLQALLLVATGRTAEVPPVLERLRQAASGADDEEAVVAWSRAVHARLNLDEGSWTEAMQRIEHAVALQPSDPALHMLMGEAFAAVREQTQANEAFAAAFRLDSNWISAGLTYARSLLQVGRAEDAFAVARHVFMRADRSMLSPYLVYAQTYLAALDAGGNPRVTATLASIGGGVAELFRDIYRQVPDRPEVAALLAEVYVRDRQPDAATAFIDEVMEQASPSADVLRGLAQVSRRHGLDRERPLLERARQIAGLTLPIAYALADLEADAGRTGAGLALIDEATAAADEAIVGSLQARQARVAYLVRIEHPESAGELQAFAADFSDVPVAQSYVLSVPLAWADEALVGTTIENLQTILGERSQRARLARAQWLVRFHAEEEARLAEAIMLLNGVLEESPDSLAALTFMAEASLLGDHPSPQRAVAHLQRAIDVAPGQTDLYTRLIPLLQQQGSYAEAGQYLQRLAALDVQDDRFRRTELRLLQQQGDFETALIRATTLLGSSTDEADQLVLAALHRRAGQLEAAEAIYDALLDRADCSPTAVAAAASFVADTGRFEEGRRLLEQLPEDGRGRRALLLGRFHRQHGDADDAERWLEQAVREAPDAAEARLELARQSLERGDAAVAREHALVGLQADPENAALRSTLAMAQLVAGEAAPGQAMAVLRELSGDDEDLLAMLELVEWLASRGGDRVSRDALERARRLTETNGGLPAAWTLACRLHVQAGRLDDAIELARRAVGRFPADPAVARMAADLLQQAGRWNEALVEAEQWRRRSLEDTLPADTVIARCLVQLDRPADAVDQLSPHARRVEAQADRNPDPLAIWVQALLADDRGDEAVVLIGSRLQDDAAWRSRWVGIALSLPDAAAAAALGRLEDVPVAAPREQLGIASAWNQLALRSGVAERFATAQSWAERAASAATGDVRLDALVVRGAIAEGRGEADRAEALYRQVLAEAPDHGVALNNLAFVLAETGRADEAIDLARRALEVQPEQPDVLDTFAHALLAAGRAGEAERTLQRALALRPGDPAIMLTLVEALMSGGQYQQAQRRLIEATGLLQSARRPLRDQIDRADELRRQLEVKLSAAPGDDGRSRVSEAGPDRPDAP
jgi:tetratricopeptide (TPR) repeat protein